MRNLEQLRAQNAIAAAPGIGTGKEGGRTVAKKVPAMILADGFIGAMAFAIEEAKDSKEKNGKEKSGGKETVFRAIINHLKTCGMMHGIQREDLQGFLDDLCTKDANVLRAITAEAMAYLNYLRRFAKPGKGEAK